MPEQAKSSLVLNAGARQVERSGLAKVFVPPATRTWHSVAHMEVIQAVERCFKDAGFHIRSEKLCLVRNDRRMFAVMILATALAAGVGLAAGVRNSLALPPAARPPGPHGPGQPGLRPGSGADG